ncbi:MAG TPA: DUF3048 domain-containing protein [Acidimicrobiales bacterium]|nr:DUF3048 domain-containing protein [Acidimicrobiales bacterium]
MTPLRTPTRRVLALTVAASAVLAACGGGGESASTTETPTTRATTTTTEATTTTTTEAPTTTVASTTTIPIPIAPLTGLPAADALYAARPALVVKYDNHRDARPHAGLNQADIVYEEIVEGITRFFAIFQSTDASPIGPIRSARTTDVDLINQLNRPFFVWSGGNRNVVRAIGNANGVSRAHGQGPGWYRDPDRRRRTAVEHTLMNDGTPGLFATVEPGQGTPFPFFSYRPAGVASAGQPVTTIDAQLDGVNLQWMWDPAQGVWIRSEYGAPHVDASGAPITASNVVVQFVPYQASSADRRSPEAVTVGEGDAWVFTDGKLIFAHWSRPDASRPAVFTDAGGQPVLLTPGRTWIELAEAGVSAVGYA